MISVKSIKLWYFIHLKKNGTFTYFYQKLFQPSFFVPFSHNFKGKNPRDGTPQRGRFPKTPPRRSLAKHRHDITTPYCENASQPTRVEHFHGARVGDPIFWCFCRTKWKSFVMSGTSSIISYFTHTQFMSNPYLPILFPHQTLHRTPYWRASETATGAHSQLLYGIKTCISQGFEDCDSS